MRRNALGTTVAPFDSIIGFCQTSSHKCLPLKGHPFYNIFSNFAKFFIGFCQTLSHKCLSVEKGIFSTIYFVLHWIMSNFVSKFLWVSKYIPCLFKSRWVPEGFQAFVFLKQVATDPLFEVWRRKAPAKSF